jgi:DNA-binding XRE family transcriptional regulator/quercetin dioxygenase-like cupin family protein
MSEATVPAIGARIRAERLRRGMTVRGLARDIGVSASLISQIETEKSRPSVSTLYAITTALGLPVEDLFDARDDADAVVTGAPASPDGHGGAVHAIAPGRVAIPDGTGTSPGPYVPPGARERLVLDSGVTWERLGRLPDTHVDFLLVTYEPGGASSSSGELMRHSGTEYGYLISGELVLTLGFDQYHLGPGDGVCFASTTPHGYRNEGSVPAVGVWFVQEDV